LHGYWLHIGRIVWVVVAVLCQEGLPDCHKDAKAAKVWLNLIAENWNIIISGALNGTRRGVQGGHHMAKQEHLDLLKQGVEVWNQWWIERLDRIVPDLIGANLNGANLSFSFLREANLRGAKLLGANLNGANLIQANLTRADLSSATLESTYLESAILRGAILSGANLIQADLTRADLSSAILRGANLQGANLSGVSLWQADLRGADLSDVDLIQADLRGADLSEANLSRALLIETNLIKATLTQCSVYGVSVWNVRLEGTKQESLTITREGEPAIKVDDLEVAQFIYLLLNYKKLRDIFNTVTERGVLILGRFGGGGLNMGS
jgi:uncharacterized protein YjbI with pentapeptide repeats